MIVHKGMIVLSKRSLLELRRAESALGMPTT